ncbi:MAG TPA: biopolymer transporter ExbD, partial [Acidobacteriota bacterium]|nr:biopolymer transporter ExbD [Acidobacteriota bacterium]
MQELDEEDAITGINVTPLVDITLVLLIIFMVTARFISEPSIGINLPKTSQQSTPPAADNNVFLTITSNHDIFLGNKKVTQSDLGNAAKSMLQEKPNMTVIVRAD